MSILFVGGEMGSFVPATANAYETTTLLGYNTAFSRCAMALIGQFDYVESSDFGSGASLYCHFDLAVSSVTGATEHYRFRWCDGSGTEVIRLAHISSTQTLRLDYWNGSAWVSAGSLNVDLDAARQTIDIAAVVNSASGSLKLYLSGTERIDSGTIDLSGITALGKLRFYGPTTITGTLVSQCIVADEPTIGMRVFTVAPSGAGATSDWTGAYTEIDEITYNDGDFINSPSANQVSTFSISPGTLTGYQVRAVAVTARAKCGASGPQNLQLALRSSGTNYFSGSKALDVGYGAFCNIWETNPATSAAWVNTAVAGLQPGVKSIA